MMKICAGQFYKNNFIDIRVLSDLWSPGVGGTPKLGAPPVVTSAGRLESAEPPITAATPPGSILTSPQPSSSPPPPPSLPPTSHGCSQIRRISQGGSSGGVVVVGIKLSLQHYSD